MPADEIVLRPIGSVRGGRVEATDDEWGSVEAVIQIDERFAVDALAGLTDFSHLDVVFFFDQVREEKIQEGARRPRGREDWPLVGVFAQRNKARPNRLGVTTCELVSVDGRTIHVRGLDAIDGTPVLDIKPYVTGYAPRSAVREPEWIKELMRDYW